MTQAQPSADLPLLSLCFVLRTFDATLLGGLGDYAAADLARLLTSDAVVPADTALYQLRADVQAAVCQRLRRERPGDEIALHLRAFHYCLARVRRSLAGQRDLAAEERCFYHLGELRELLTEHREWHTLAELLNATRVIAPTRPRYQHLLSLYDGFLAIRTLDYARGEALLQALLDQPQLDQDVQIRALHALGFSQLQQACYDRALEYMQRFYELACASGDLVYQGGALINMGIIYNETGYYERSLTFLRQSLPIFRALGDQYREARVLWHIGNDELHLGRWQAAQEHTQAAIDVYRALGVEASLANLYWCQGYLAHLLGQEQASEESYQRGLRIACSAEHGDCRAEMDLSLYLGFLYQTQRRLPAALACYEQAASCAEQVHDPHLRALILYRRSQVLQAQQRPAEALATYQQSIDLCEALRGATNDEVIKLGLLGTTQHIYESLVLLHLEQGQPAEAFHTIERARSRAFLDMLDQKAPELYATVDQPVVTLAEVQATLPPGALLVEFFTTGVVPPGEHLLHTLPPENQRLRQYLTPPARILIFAITRDGYEIHHVAPELDPNQLQPDAADPAPGRRWLRERALEELYRRLIAPIEHLLPGHDLLYLIPHGPLHYLPFTALRSAAGAYLVASDRPALAFAPSATVLLRSCLSRPATIASGMLALGYNDPQADLRYAESEARLVARLMQGAVWSDAEPKSERLLRVGPQLRWLHIAGHAAYDPHSPLDSTLHLGCDDPLSARTIIEQLELGVELVTLSACTTGLSAVVPGDELLGLQRALLYAGAPTVIGTLWDAYDFVTLLIMEQFYTSLCAGCSAAVALRDAQISVREMSLGDVATALRRWAADDQERPIFSNFPTIANEQYATRPYAAPEYWAPFMLTGRP